MVVGVVFVLSGTPSATSGSGSVTATMGKRSGFGDSLLGAGGATIGEAIGSTASRPCTVTGSFTAITMANGATFAIVGSQSDICGCDSVTVITAASNGAGPDITSGVIRAGSGVVTGCTD